LVVQTQTKEKEMGSFGANKSSIPSCKLEQWHVTANIVAKNPERYPTIEVGAEKELEAMSTCACENCSTLFKCVKCQGSISLKQFSTQEEKGWQHLCMPCTESWIDEMIQKQASPNN
jgi:hypothetical protein